MAKIDFKNATVKFLDGTSPTPNEISIIMGEGTVSWSEKRPIEFIKDRGVLWQTRLGDQEPCDVKLDIVWEFLRSESGGGATPYEFLKKIGAASAFATVGGACEPHAVSIVITHTPICSTEDLEKIVLSPFYYTSIDPDPKPGTIGISGMLNALAPTITRVART